jgi:surfeit locus 1 family protein
MRRLIFPLVLGIGGGLILISLGIWQLQRLSIKEEMIRQLEARIAAAPGELPPILVPERDRYMPVAIDGSFLPGEILVLVSVRGVGPGYRVIEPFQTASGRRILIDRGFISEDERGVPRVASAARVVGNLDWPDEVDNFTPSPVARDVPEMARRLGTDPVLVVQREVSVSDGPMLAGPRPRRRPLRARPSSWCWPQLAARPRSPPCSPDADRSTSEVAFRVDAPPFLGEAISATTSSAAHRARLCGLRPRRPRAPRPARPEPLPARALPRADARLQGLRDAAHRPALPGWR